MGLRADIYKHKGRSFANGGLSGDHDEVTIVNVDGPFEPTDDAPGVELVSGNLPGTVKIVPTVETLQALYDYERRGIGPMMGGCYVGTSDSRLGQAIRKLTGDRPGAHREGMVALHDRYETPAQYRALST